MGSGTIFPFKHVPLLKMLLGKMVPNPLTENILTWRRN
jgi:hypothetical protein